MVYIKSYFGKVSLYYLYRELLQETSTFTVYKAKSSGIVEPNEYYKSFLYFRIVFVQKRYSQTIFYRE